jgi:cephalosporin-C deacetylase
VISYGPPENLVEFWEETVREAEQAKLEISRSAFPSHEEADHVIHTYSFVGIDGKTLNGWIAVPKEREGRMPSFLWVPPYGRESLLPNQYGTRKGYVSVSLNFHGHEAFHQEKYIPARGYFAEGAEEPETWIFRRMFQNALICMRVMQTFLEVDEQRLAVMGMSQGGGISIWLGAWYKAVKCVVADMPFLGLCEQILGRQAYRYPTKELMDFVDNTPMGEERLLYTLSYFDTKHQAAHLKVPCQISLGEKDPSVPPPTAEAIFEAIPTEKRLIRYPGGHDWTPEMVENNLEWLGKWV